jgi:ankyrin repeat protein
MNRTVRDSAAEVKQELSILEGSMDRLRELLANPTFDKNRPNSSGLTPLMATILRGGKEHVLLLVESGAIPTAVEVAAAAMLHAMAEGDFLEAQRKWAEKSSEGIARSQASNVLSPFEINRAEPDVS